MFHSSNPVLTNDDTFREFYGPSGGLADQANVATLQGVVNKTGFLALLAVIAGAGGYTFVASFPSLMLISGITATVICLGLYFVAQRNPAQAHIIGPVYAIVQGAFLGVLTGFIDRLLADMGYKAAGGVALQAFIITASILVVMLGLYSFRILRPSRRFVSIVSVATGGIMLTYLVGFVLSFFGTALPFISLGSAFQGGTAGLIGLGLNVLILGVASMWLIIDFGMIETRLAQGGPKSEEWFLAFALIVSLAWVYFEAVKLVFRLTLMFNRD